MGSGVPPLIPIAQPWLGEEEGEAVLEVLASGRLAQGERVALLEERFAAYCGTRYAIATSSGTTALMTALLAHGLGPGDEVITTPFTFIATANAVLFTGARPVFADISWDDYNIDVNQIAARITPRTRALLVVHLYGHPCAMAAITALAAERDLALIEDACQAHGATVDGRKVGSFGTGCFSFYATKSMTSGEGGIITTNDPAIAERARLIRNHGEGERYHHQTLGYNFRLTELQAALALVQLERLEEQTERRIANAARLSKLLAQCPGIILPKVRPGYRHVFHQYTVLLPEGCQREALLRRLQRAGIEARAYYPLPIYQQPLYRQLGYGEELPVSEAASRRVLSLPVHPGVTEEQLAHIAQEVSRL